ncbi:MAG: head GIN domain-containing protein [Bacteroidales bacterium]|nr:head GIN domain-containing protein [Bacteroidales bacterium]
MKSKIILASMLIAFSLVSISSFAASEKKENRKVSSFSSLSLSISADVYITQGSKTEVILEGDANTLDNIETEVSNGNLKIKYDSKWSSWSKTKKVKVYVTSPDWDGISVSGSGNVAGNSAIEGSEFSMAVSGSGNIKLSDLSATELEARISGSGNIQIAGSKKANSLEISISGSGDYDGIGLAVDEASIRISGSGGAKVWAESKLNASVSGSGDVYYKGNAQIDARVSGSGKVRNVD